METQDKNRLHPMLRHRCVPNMFIEEVDELEFLLNGRRYHECLQELIDHDYRLDYLFFRLLDEVKEDIDKAKISAEEVAERVPFWLTETRSPFYEAIEALEALGAPPFITACLKHHPKLDVLATIDYLWHSLASYYTFEIKEIPDSILFGFWLDYWPMLADDIVEGIKLYAEKPYGEPEYLVKRQFEKHRPVVFAPQVLESNICLRDFCVFMMLFIGNLYKIIDGLYKIVASGGEECCEFILHKEDWKGTRIGVAIYPRLIAHGRVGEKYWVFFLME